MCVCVCVLAQTAQTSNRIWNNPMVDRETAEPPTVLRRMVGCTSGKVLLRVSSELTWTLMSRHEFLLKSKKTGRWSWKKAGLSLTLHMDEGCNLPLHRSWQHNLDPNNKAGQMFRIAAHKWKEGQNAGEGDDLIRQAAAEVWKNLERPPSVSPLMISHDRSSLTGSAVPACK